MDDSVTLKNESQLFIFFQESTSSSSESRSQCSYMDDATAAKKDIKAAEATEHKEGPHSEVDTCQDGETGEVRVENSPICHRPLSMHLNTFRQNVEGYQGSQS